MDNNISYEQRLNEVETLLSKIEKGEVPLDKVSENIAHIRSLLAQCREQLHGETSILTRNS